MIQTFEQSVCRSGLDSSRGPWLWPWKICLLLSTMTHCVIHIFTVVLTNLNCGDSSKGIMSISNVRHPQHWMSGRGTLSFWWRRCCQVVCCCWKARLAGNNVSILKTVSHVIYPLRVQFILNWPSCHRAFHVWCVGRRKERLLCSCVIIANVVGTWYAWGHPWLFYHLDSGFFLTIEDFRYLVLLLVVLNDHVWFSLCYACLNGKWWIIV